MGVPGPDGIVRRLVQNVAEGVSTSAMSTLFGLPRTSVYFCQAPCTSSINPARAVVEEVGPGASSSLRALAGAKEAHSEVGL